jgi:menaquinone-9 beta-reductase
MTDYDVAIVGAGPAGSSLAIQLESKEQRVLLLEEDTFPRNKTRGDPVGPKGTSVT